jgi:hypothetical protein
MPSYVWLRFHDLKARGIVANRVTLKSWIEKYGFPAGTRLGPNTIGWRDDVVAEWERSRPTSNFTEEKDS